MAYMYKTKPGLALTAKTTAFNRSKTETGTRIDTKPKITSGLNITHGLNKLEDGSSLMALLEKVSNYKFKDYFLDFDRLRKGYVSESRFRSGLGNVNNEFSETDIQLLLSKYTIGKDQVDYRSFCEDVDKVFRKEENPIAELAGTSQKFTRAEMKTLTDTLKELRNVIRANRILLKPTFADFDTTQKQRVTVQQFARVLKQLSIMPSDDVFDLICRNYFDKGNTREVNYVKFCHDVDKPEDMFAELGIKIDKAEDSKIEMLPKTILGKKTTKSNFFESTTKGINVLENRFSKPTINLSNDPTDIEQRIQTHNFFRDYDKLRKGKVTANQFTTVLSMLSFKLTDEEYDVLIAKYGTDDQMVNYAAFVDTIDSAFTIKGIEKKPTLKVASIETDTILQKSKKMLDFDDDDKQKMLEVMEAYRNVIKTRRLNIKPMFQDYDKTKSSHVTKTQFVRVLNLLGIDLSSEVLSLLLKKYMDRGNADEVNYFEFINDVDRPEDMFGAGRDFNHSYDYFSVTDPRQVEDQIIKIEPEDINDLLARIRKEVSEKRIRLQEFFRDFDRLRSGNITVPQLRISMNMAKIHLSKSEFELLTSHYASDKVGMMKWRQFCDEVDEVFTKKNLEQDVTVEIVKPDLTTKYGQTAPPKADKSLAAKLVEKFKDKLRRERLDAKSFFQSWDRHNRFKVSPKQFRQVLATFGFDLDDSEVEALCKYYSNQSGEIEYLRFLSDSNPDTQVQLEETKSKYKSRGWKFDGVSDFDTLMTKIKGIVKKGRIRLLEFFQDHDPLRKGTIPYMKFKGVLRAQKIELTDNEYEILLEKFTTEDTNLVDYITFNDEVEGIFTKKGLEKAPTAKVVEFKPPSIIDPDDVLTDAEEKVLEDCFVRIGTECKNRRLLLKPFFQDKDKINCGVVANSRFRSIFDFLKLYISDEEYKIINKRFVAKAPNEISYVEFERLLKTYSGDDKPF